MRWWPLAAFSVLHTWGLVLGGCDGAGEPAPSVTSTTAVVPQLWPRDPELVRWIGEDRLLAVSSGRQYVWDLGLDAIIDIDRLPLGQTPGRLFPAGYLHGVYLFRHASVRWERVPALERHPGAVMAPTLDRFARRSDVWSTGIVIERLDGWGTPVRIAARSASVAFSPDASRLLSCEGDAARLYDTTTGARLGQWMGGASRCTWGSSGPMLVEHDGVLTVLDPATLLPIGAPIADVGIARASADGRYLALALDGDREGLSVRAVEGGAELMFAPIGSVFDLRVVGDVMAYEVSVGVGAMTLGGVELAVPRRRAAIGHLGEHRRWARLEDGEVRIDEDGRPGRGWSGASVAWLDTGQGRLLAHERHTLFELSFEPFAVTRFGGCPEMGGRWPRGGDFPIDELPLVRGSMRVLASRGCLARDDATEVLAAIDPLEDSGSGDRFVSIDLRSVSVVDLDGLPISTLALDRSSLRCRSGRSCDTLFRISPDGAWVAVANGTSMWSFDVSSGALLGAHTLGARTVQMTFVDDGLLAHVDLAGQRTLFSPSLTTVAQWQGHPMHAPAALFAVPAEGSPHALIDHDWTTISLRALDGSLIAQRECAARDVTVVGDWIAASGAGVTLHHRDLSHSVELPGVLATWPRASLDDEVFTCDEGHLVRTAVDVDPPESRHLPEVPCELEGIHPLSGGWVAVSSRVPLLLAPDDRVFELYVATEGGSPRVALAHDGVVHGDGLEVLRITRSAAGTSVKALRAHGTVAACLDAGGCR